MWITWEDKDQHYHCTLFNHLYYFAQLIPWSSWDWCGMYIKFVIEQKHVAQRWSQSLGGYQQREGHGAHENVNTIQRRC